MNLPSFYIKPRLLIAIALILLAVPLTVFMLSRQQNTSQQASVYPACAPDVPPSGWPECRYGQDTYNKQACRNKAEEYKGVNGPGENAPDTDWFKWAQEPPKPLSCGTACGLAPSFCIVDNTPTPKPTDTPVPSKTPTPKPSKTPEPTLTTEPTATPIPTATDVPPTPTDAITSCPVPKTPPGGMNIRIECPYCGD